MHILSKVIHAVIGWLAAVDAPIETTPSLLCWSDLPTHHPRADIPDVHTGFMATGR